MTPIKAVAPKLVVLNWRWQLVDEDLPVLDASQ
jgi:hypothetical protein